MKDECTSVEFQLCTGQHLTSLEENFQFSAFFMEHPGSSSQNGNKKKESWTGAFNEQDPEEINNDVCFCSCSCYLYISFIITPSLD